MMTSLRDMAKHDWHMVESHLTAEYQTLPELATKCTIGKAKVQNALRFARMYGWVDWRTAKKQRGRLVYEHRRVMKNNS